MCCCSLASEGHTLSVWGKYAVVFQQSYYKAQVPLRLAVQLGASGCWDSKLLPFVGLCLCSCII